MTMTTVFLTFPSYNLTGEILAANRGRCPADVFIICFSPDFLFNRLQSIDDMYFPGPTTMLSVRTSTFWWKTFLRLSNFLKTKLYPIQFMTRSIICWWKTHGKLCQKKILEVQGIALLIKTSEEFYRVIKNTISIFEYFNSHIIWLKTWQGQNDREKEGSKNMYASIFHFYGNISPIFHNYLLNIHNTSIFWGQPFHRLCQSLLYIL